MADIHEHEGHVDGFFDIEGVVHYEFYVRDKQ
jgi:hypothetical protein